MDLAVTLIKSVLRAFYETREILIIDAVMLYEAWVGTFGSDRMFFKLTSI